MFAGKAFSEMAEEEFLKLFQAGQFPLAQWKHRPHVTVAYLYLSQHPLEAAIDRIRTGIQAHNAANNLANAYHETLTQFWARLIHFVMQTHGPSDSAKNFFERHSYLLNKMLPLLYYSYPRLISLEAREGFLLPDLQPLPVLPDEKVYEARYQADPFYPPIPPDPLLELAKLNQALEEKPDDCQIWYQRGGVYLQLGDFSAAMSDYQRTLELCPKHYGACYGLGALFARQNELVPALEYLQKALDYGFPYLQFVERDESWNNFRNEKAFQTVMFEAYLARSKNKDKQ